MKPIRHWITAFFGFSRSETNAFLVLLPLMAVFILSPPIYRWWLLRQPREAYNSARLDSLVASWNWTKPKDSIATPASAQPFSFDPNTASIEDLLRLGFPPKASQRLVRYRAKGGRFRVKSDLRKLYGVDSLLLTRLNEYILLPDKIIRLPAGRMRQTSSPQTTAFDLNLADSIQLGGIYGIGPVLSKRIIRYRERLGGYVSMEQLNEVYGLDTTVIVRLKNKSFISDGFRPRQINVNSADEKKLNSMPYIKFHLAKSITAYRFQHGDFTSIEDLQRLSLMNDTLLQKIKPYLTLKD